MKNLFDELCMHIGHFTAAQLAADDRSRLYFARRKSLDSFEQKQSIPKLCMQKEGPTYTKGAFT